MHRFIAIILKLITLYAHLCYLRYCCKHCYCYFEFLWYIFIDIVLKFVDFNWWYEFMKSYQQLFIVIGSLYIYIWKDTIICQQILINILYTFLKSLQISICIQDLWIDRNNMYNEIIKYLFPNYYYYCN